MICLLLSARKASVNIVDRIIILIDLFFCQARTYCWRFNTGVVCVVVVCYISILLLLNFPFLAHNLLPGNLCICRLSFVCSRVFTFKSSQKLLSKNLAVMVLGWSPFKIVSDSATLFLRWLPSIQVSCLN